MAITVKFTASVGQDKGTKTDVWCAGYIPRANIAINDFLLWATAADTNVGPTGIYLRDVSSLNYWYLTPNTVVTATNSGNVITKIGWVKIGGLPVGTNLIRVELYGMALDDSKAGGSFVVSGISDSPFDTSSVGTGSSGSPSSGASGTLAQASEIIFGAIGSEEDRAGTPGTWTAGDGYVTGITGNQSRFGTSGAGAASNITLDMAVEIVSATTAQIAAKTGCDSRDWAAAVATFKDAATAAVARRRALLGVGL